MDAEERVIPQVSLLKRWLYPTYRKYFSRAYLFEGVLKSGKGSVKCLFVDNDKFYLEVMQKLFKESPKLIRTYRCWIPGLKRLVKSPGTDADICFANVELRYASLFQDSTTYTMQTRVAQTLDIASVLETNKRYRDRRRGVNSKNRKFGLSCRISHSSEDFDFFYHRMAKPLVSKFGDTAMEDTYEELKPFFEKGLLLLVLCGGEPISGVICYENDGIFTAYRSGLLDGDSSYLHKGAMSAWYFFLLEYARQQGYQKVDFMRSMPFLNDGVYMTKQHWGATTEPFLDSSTWVYLFNRSSPEKFAYIIENIPLIVHTNNGLEGVVSVPDETMMTPEFEQKLISQYGAPGISGLQLLSGNGTIKYVKL